MFGIGAAEIVILGFCCMVFLMVIAGMVLAVISQRWEKSPGPVVVNSPHPLPAQPAHPAASAEPITHLDVIASITKRFCPQCRVALPADSPEGLCPACLLAGGMESALSPQVVDGSALTTPPSGSQPPLGGEIGDLQQHFPQLEILELLGRGGMGAVYKVRQRNLDRIVALKVIPPDAADDPTFAERFAREARALARLNHPNIVTVHDFGQAGSTYYLIMEYIDGVNLRQTLQAGRLAPPEALAIVPQICDALQYAHDQGVVHRDIKPENVLLDRSGRVKIADFGLAKLIGKGPDDYTLTRTQQVMGTPRYMAPEQIETPATVDHRADIYSLGVVIYEMLTGELPLGRFPAPSERVQLDVRIDQVVLRALEKEPDRRYQRASQVKTELASASSGAAPVAATVAATLPRVRPAIPVLTPPAKPFGLESHAPPPFAQVFAIVVGMALGLLLTTAGVSGVGTYIAGSNLVPHQTGLFGSSAVQAAWNWNLLSLALFVAGLGAIVVSLATYRQLSGAIDLLRTQQTTWFDWLLRTLGCLGIVLLLAQILAWRDDVIHVFGSPGLMALAISGVGLVARFLASRQADSESFLPAVTAPSFLLAVGAPTLAAAAVFLALFIDVSFAQPAFDPEIREPLYASEWYFVAWKQVILSVALVIVPTLFALLAAWRTYGPRSRTDEGVERVASPFASRWWLVGAGLVGVSTLFIPWFQLQVEKGAVVSLPYGMIHFRMYQNDNSLRDDSVIFQEGSFRSLAGMPAGWRFAHRGYSLPESVLVAVLLALMAGVACLPMAGLSPGANGLAIACGLLGLLLTMALVHRNADRDSAILVDETTLRGLERYVREAKGQQPWSVRPWATPAAQAFSAKPSVGMILAFAACGLALVAGVCNFAWGDATLVKRTAAKVAANASESARRTAIRQQVSGPAMGLMVTGALGLLPLLLACIFAPVLTLKSEVAPMSQATWSSMQMHATTGLLAARQGDLPTALNVATSMLLGWQAMPQRQEPNMTGWSVGILLPLMMLNLVFSAVVFVGGWRMSQLKSHGLAMVATILAILPCTLGWIVGLPMGLWALFTLITPEVRLMFDRDPQEPDSPLQPTSQPNAKPDAVPIALTAEQRVEVVRSVREPAWGLMVAGGLSMLPFLVMVVVLLSFLEHDAMRRAPYAQTRYLFDDAGAGPLWFAVLPSLPLAIMAFVGGRALRNLTSYQVAWLGSLAAMLPCGPAWLLTLPLGIWAMITLQRPDVKAAFER